MTSLRLGLSLCVAGLLVATGCPAGDDEDSGDDAAMTTMPMGSDTGNEEDSSGGEPGDSSGGSTDLSHDADIQPIWDAHCTTDCHEPGGAYVTFIDLSEGAYERIVGVAATTVPSIDFIEPNDPDASYIWHKIQNTQLSVGGNGDGMPYPSSNPPTMLTQEELDTIEEWIRGGAPQ